MSSSTAAELGRRWREVYWLWLGAVALLLAAEVLLGPDRSALAALHHPWVQAHYERIETYSDYGLWVFYLYFLGMLGLGLLRRRPALTRIGVSYLVAQLLALTLVNLLKRVIGAPRPRALNDEWPERRFGLQWDWDFHALPSGHSADAFVGAVMAALLLASPRARLVVMLFALSIGISRVVLSKHWLLDVAAGALIGGAVVLVLLAPARTRRILRVGRTPADFS